MKVIKRVFIIYCIILSILLLFKFNLSINAIMNKIDSVRLSREHGAWNISLKPFGTIASQLQRIKTIPIIVIKNLVGNIVVFVPFGFLLPMGFEAMRKYHRTFLTGLVYILIVELVQFICMLGAFDVDDIILNSIGVSCGYVIFKIILKVWSQRKQI
ncbi:MAG: VanZ family protein [Lachnospiraceae bacterium]|nr:VanZ family protein [Lachnospiraceae bacterium]